MIFLGCGFLFCQRQLIAVWIMPCLMFFLGIDWGCGLGAAYCRVEVPASSYCVRGYQHGLAPVILTLMAWLRFCLPGVSTVCVIFTFHWKCFTKSSLDSRLSSTSWNREYLYYLQFFYKKNLSLSPHLFIHLYQYGFMYICTVAYNPIVCYFVNQNSFSFGHRDLF